MNTCEPTHYLTQGVEHNQQHLYACKFFTYPTTVFFQK